MLFSFSLFELRGDFLFGVFKSYSIGDDGSLPSPLTLYDLLYLFELLDILSLTLIILEITVILWFLCYKMLPLIKSISSKLWFCCPYSYLSSSDRLSSWASTRSATIRDSYIMLFISCCWQAISFWASTLILIAFRSL